MTFSPTMQVFEVQTHSEDAENLERWRNSKRSKVRRKNIMKDSALVPLKSFRISTFGLNNSDSINYQIWKKKLRKFRATSWVVKICTDFVFCQNTFVSSFWINNLLHFFVDISCCFDCYRKSIMKQWLPIYWKHSKLEH